MNQNQRDGMVREEGGGRREEGSGWGTHVYLLQIHFDIWQNQYNIVMLNKIKLKKRKQKCDRHRERKILDGALQKSKFIQQML